MTQTKIATPGFWYDDFFLLDLHTILQTEEQLGHIKEQT